MLSVPPRDQPLVTQPGGFTKTLLRAGLTLLLKVLAPESLSFLICKRGMRIPWVIFVRSCLWSHWRRVIVSTDGLCLFLVLHIIRYHVILVKHWRCYEEAQLTTVPMWTPLLLSHHTSFLLNLLLAHVKMVTLLAFMTSVFLPSSCLNFFLLPHLFPFSLFPFIIFKVSLFCPLLFLASPLRLFVSRSSCQSHIKLPRLLNLGQPVSALLEGLRCHK